MNQLKDFYDYLFLYFYNLKKKDDSTPAYFPIILITAAQTGNLLFVIILIFYFLRVSFDIIPSLFLVLTFGLLIFNFYNYTIKAKAEKIVKKDSQLSLRFKLLSYAYILISYLSPLVLIYILNEYFG